MVISTERFKHGKITIGKDIFFYENNGSFIRITAYKYVDKFPVFVDEEDGKRYFHIHIPETIDGFPVLIVNDIHWGLYSVADPSVPGCHVVKVHLPEDTAYEGMYMGNTSSFCVPNKKKNPEFMFESTETYYPRKNQLLKTDEGAFHFICGANHNDHTCQVLAIRRNKHINKNWVWTKGAQDLTPEEKLVVPSQIGEYTVSEICIGRTHKLAEDVKDVKEVHIEEGIEVIGENCFSDLQYLENVYLPKSMKQIGTAAFSLFISSENVRADSVPTLNVHYYDVMPALGENAFLRYGNEEVYDDYADWGLMRVGNIRHDYEVVYQKNNI